MRRKTKSHAGTGDSTRQTGLARVLSKLGYCSRSQASEFIRAGRVKLNGAVRRDPETPTRMAKDQISVDDRPVKASEKRYYLLNKPRGVVTTAADEKGRETVYEYLPKTLSWTAPVGRLDKASEGLLLLTNDSEWAARIAAPETHLDKTYHVQINAVADEALLQKLRDGMAARGGDFLAVKRADILRQGERTSWLEIVLDEGKNRHIRRMLEPLDIEVLRIVRVAIGPLVLGELAKGQSRELSAAEKASLTRAMLGLTN